MNTYPKSQTILVEQLQIHFCTDYNMDHSTTHWLEKAILAYFIVHKVGHLKGIAGIFMACLFSGALSTASSGLNAMSALMLEDIFKRIYPNMDEKRATRISKGVACFCGILITAGGFLVSYAGTMVLQLAQTIFGCVAAPYFGVFTLGIFFRRANSKGAVVGTVAGLGMTMWMSIGAIMYPPNKYPAPLSIKNCPSTNRTINGTDILSYHYSGYDFPLAKLYSVSYLWFGLIGLIVTVTVGLVTSLIFRSHISEEPHPGLLFDFRGLCLPSRRKKKLTLYALDVKELKDNEDNTLHGR